MYVFMYMYVYNLEDNKIKESLILVYIKWGKLEV